MRCGVPLSRIHASCSAGAVVLVIVAAATRSKLRLAVRLRRLGDRVRGRSGALTTALRMRAGERGGILRRR